MKVIILGLGNFGAALAIRMTQLGHEVIGVDNDAHRVEEIKEKVTSTICMDARELHDLKYLPLDDADAVLVAIGEDFGASVLITAQLKQLGVSRLIARSMSGLHRTVLEAIGVSDIFSPELEMAESFALKMELKNVNNVYHISQDYKIVESAVPKLMVNKPLSGIDFAASYDLNLIAVKRSEKVRNLIGMASTEQRLHSKLGPEFILLEGDVLVLAGSVDALKHLYAVL
ncbi:potassium channel family protein [Williamwhitmania taraxaci]|uniref:Trk system potassium uptake protein TrkA n=1 Tax=Williamwhitmania taraxaci TaxID=1640674 RepID=A0A1G6H2F4_9BACT|nr:TrkA family potassium uptake protein [Williamwhitmania taraxaci]SDB88334.1 trk system potassium uptake protein TrkA [Williamwhitmania taraxaci]